jgi:hypothetical protein
MLQDELLLQDAKTLWLLRVALFDDDDLGVVSVLAVRLIGVEVHVNAKSPELPRRHVRGLTMVTLDTFRWERRDNSVSFPIIGILALSTTILTLDVRIPARKCKEIMTTILILNVAANVVVIFV